MLRYLETPDGQKYSIEAGQTHIPCFRCGLCCTYLRAKLTTNDLRMLAKELRVSNDDLIHRYVEKISIGYLLRQIDNRCVFLIWEDSGTPAICSVYPSRPEACRNWVPSLSHPECQEGLRKLGKSGKIFLPTEIYQSEDEIIELYSTIRESAEINKDSEV